MLKETPIITWTNPADVTYGEPLGPGQLNAKIATVTTLLTDGFSGSALDASKWTVRTNVPKGAAAVAVVGGEVGLRNRGYLVSKHEFDPLVSGPLHLSGTWRFSDYQSEDYLQILTRSSGEPEAPWGDTSSGIEFGLATLGATNPAIVPRGSAVVTTVTPGSPLYVGFDDTVAFDIDDDGHNLSFTIANKTRGGTSTVTAISDSQMPTNFITFHNRETEMGVNFTAYLDDVELSGKTQGSFVYTPAAGTILSAGKGQLLSARFKPVDSSNSNESSQSMPVNVLKSPLTITPANGIRMYGNANAPLTGTIAGLQNGDRIAAVQHHGVSGQPRRQVRHHGLRRRSRRATGQL